MTAPPTDDLKPTLGLRSATALIIGGTVGSGIFLLPGYVIDALPSPGLAIAAWVVGGLLALAAALTFAELGGMFPRAGGQYVFLREAFGPRPAFLFGWVAFTVAYSGAIAAIAVACATYAAVLMPLSPFGVKVLAVGIILLLTAVNIGSTRLAALVQDAATFAKVIGLAALVAGIGYAAMAGGGADAAADAAAPVLTVAPGLGVIAAFGLALGLVLFAYDGWASATFVAGEIRDAPRNLPRAALIAVTTVTLLYAGVNVLILAVLPVGAAAGSERVMFDVAERVLGGTGGLVTAALVMLTTFGSTAAWVLQSPRIYYAMARDRLVYQGFGRVSERFGTPAFALILQAEWACLLVLTGTFADLVAYVVVSLWVMNGITGWALFRLRRTRPDLPRPYRVHGYPVVPALFIATAVFVVGSMLILDLRNALIGLGLTALGIPVYEWLRVSAARRGAEAGDAADDAPSSKTDV